MSDNFDDDSLSPNSEVEDDEMDNSQSASQSQSLSSQAPSSASKTRRRSIIPPPPSAHIGPPPAPITSLSRSELEEMKVQHVGAWILRPSLYRARLRCLLSKLDSQNLRLSSKSCQTYLNHKDVHGQFKNDLMSEKAWPNFAAFPAPDEMTNAQKQARIQALVKFAIESYESLLKSGSSSGSSASPSVARSASASASPAPTRPSSSIASSSQTPKSASKRPMEHSQSQHKKAEIPRQQQRKRERDESAFLFSSDFFTDEDYRLYVQEQFLQIDVSSIQRKKGPGEWTSQEDDFLVSAMWDEFVSFEDMADNSKTKKNVEDIQERLSFLLKAATEKEPTAPLPSASSASSSSAPAASSSMTFDENDDDDDEFPSIDLENLPSSPSDSSPPKRQRRDTTSASSSAAVVSSPLSSSMSLSLADCLELEKKSFESEFFSNQLFQRQARLLFSNFVREPEESNMSDWAEFHDVLLLEAIQNEDNSSFEQLAAMMEVNSETISNHAAILFNKALHQYSESIRRSSSRPVPQQRETPKLKVEEQPSPLSSLLAAQSPLSSSSSASVNQGAVPTPSESQSPSAPIISIAAPTLMLPAAAAPPPPLSHSVASSSAPLAAALSLPQPTPSAASQGPTKRVYFSYCMPDGETVRRLTVNLPCDLNTLEELQKFIRTRLNQKAQHTPTEAIPNPKKIIYSIDKFDIYCAFLSNRKKVGDDFMLVDSDRLVQQISADDHLFSSVKKNERINT